LYARRTTGRRNVAVETQTTHVAPKPGNLQEAARRLGMDGRMVRTKLDVRSDRKTAG
jgi:ActR/RegA family two-component response regulator